MIIVCVSSGSLLKSQQLQLLIEEKSKEDAFFSFFLDHIIDGRVLWKYHALSFNENQFIEARMIIVCFENLEQ